MVRGLAVRFLAIAWLLISAGSAFAANGAAEGVVPGASARLDGSVRVLTVGADIFIGDTVKTDATGQVQIRFSDATELVVGPNSSLVLEDYLQRGDGSAGKLAIDALSGTFRFVTGTSAKSRYQISTPTGTIGVRGTAFDFVVDARSTQVLLYHGAAILCSNAADCVTLTRSCEVGRYESRQSELLGLTRKLARGDRDALRDAFRYAGSQQPLLPEFRVKQANTCLRRLPSEPAAAEDDAKAPVAIDPCAGANSCPAPDPCATAGACAPDPDPGTDHPGDDGSDDDGDDRGDHNHDGHSDNGQGHDHGGDGNGHNHGHGGGRGGGH